MHREHDSLTYVGNERDSFRKYNRRTLRGIALIDRFAPRGQSEANFVDAKNINEQKVEARL